MSAVPAIDPISPRPVLRFGSPTASVSQELEGLTLTESRGGLSTLEVRLRMLREVEGGGVAFPFEETEPVKLGQTIFLGLGDEGSPTSAFRGVITAIEEVWGRGTPHIVLLCDDVLQKLRMKRRTKLYTDFDVAAFVRDATSGLTLNPRIEGFDQPLGPQLQLDESDLAFLRRVLADHDGELQVIENELHIRRIKDIARGTIDLDVDHDFERCRITADLAHQVTEVSVSGWDSVQGRRFGKTSADLDLGPGSGKTGAQWLELATILGRRSEHVGHVPVADASEAEALVRTVASKRARSFVRLDATHHGDPRIRVGVHVRLEGVGSRFRNTFVVTHCTHRYDRNSGGYLVDFQAECAFLKDPS